MDDFGGGYGMDEKRRPGGSSTRQYGRDERLRDLDKAAGALKSELKYDETGQDALGLDAADGDRSGGYNISSPLLECVSSMEVPPLIQNACRRAKGAQWMTTGFLPEVMRAYVTIDRRLFIWNFSNVNQSNMNAAVECDYEMGTIIVAVGLVRSTQELERDEEVRYVLVIATAYDIVVRKLKFQNDIVHNRMTVESESFSVPTDGVIMRKIVGTPNGRIFMGGDDGNLYEVVYAKNQSWCGGRRRKCRKLNHTTSPYHARGFLRLLIPRQIWGALPEIVDIAYDASRKQNWLLFALCADNSIWVFGLGRNGTEIRHIAHKSNVLSEARFRLAASGGGGQDQEDWDDKTFRITSIHSIPRRSESRTASLVAVTNHGHRIIFEYQNNAVFSFSGFEVAYVRQCPERLFRREKTLSAGSTRTRIAARFKPNQSPQSVKLAYYSNGTFLFADERLSDLKENWHGDTLVAVHADARQTAQNRVINEMIDDVKLLNKAMDQDNTIHCVTEVPVEAYTTTLAASLMAEGEETPLKGLSPFATQHILPQRKFLVLTGNRILLYQKRRPIDELQDLLSGELDRNRVDRFFKFNGKEASAMCLTLTCSAQNGTDTGAGAYGSRGGRYYSSIGRGGLPRRGDFGSRMGSPSNALVLASPDRFRSRRDVTKAVRRNALRVLQDQRQRARRWRLGRETELKGANAITTEDEYYSPVHNALYLYASRLLRPVWRNSLAYFPDPAARGREIRFLHTSKDFRAVRQSLQTLNETLNDILERSGAAFGARGRSSESSESSELKSLQRLRNLLEISAESLSIIVIMAGERMLRDQVKRERLKELGSMPFSDVVTTDKGWRLLKALIAAMLETRQDRGPLREELGRQCPTFFHKYEVKLSMGNECLQRAKEGSRNSDMIACQDALKEALQHYKDAAKSQDFDVKRVCEGFASHPIYFYRGVVELALFRAAYLTRDDIKMPAGWRPEPGVKGSVKGYKDSEREKCYDFILNLFANVKPLRKEAFSDAPAENRDSLERRFGDAVSDAVQYALSSTDDDFINKCLPSLIKRKEMHQYLFNSGSKKLIRFLERNRRGYVDFLSRLYFKSRRFEEAAVLLYEVAIESKEGTLEKRMEWLFRCDECAKEALQRRRVGGAVSVGARRYVVDTDFVERVRVRIGNYTAQQKVLAELQRSLSDGEDSKQDQEALAQDCKQLKSRMFDLSELYSVANKRGLYESILWIYQISRSRNDEVVKTAWGNIIKLRILKSNKRGEDWRDAMMTLPTCFNKYDKVFPLDHICSEIEQHNQRQKRRRQPTEPRLLYSVLKEMKVPLSRIIRAYRRLLVTERNELVRAHLKTVQYVTEDFLRSPDRSDNRAALLYLLNDAMAKTNEGSQDREGLENLHRKMQSL